MSDNHRNSKLPLTVRQREALELIRSSIRKRGYGPTVRELAVCMGIRSPNGVLGHLSALAKKGFICREANLSRSIVLTESSTQKNEIPVIAILENGSLLENPNPHETIDITEKFQIEGQEFSWIRVQDNYFWNEFHLKKGDLLLIRRSRNASEGETVILYNRKNDFLLAKCQFDESLGKCVLKNRTGNFENSCSGVFGILIFVMRMEF